MHENEEIDENIIMKCLKHNKKLEGINLRLTFVCILTQPEN